MPTGKIHARRAGAGYYSYLRHKDDLNEWQQKHVGPVSKAEAVRLKRIGGEPAELRSNGEVVALADVRRTGDGTPLPTRKECLEAIRAGLEILDYHLLVEWAYDAESRRRIQDLQARVTQVRERAEHLWPEVGSQMKRGKA